MGQNLSIGQFDYNNAPWLKPTMPNFNFCAQWSNTPMFNFTGSTWNDTNDFSSTGTSAKAETFEQYKARLEKERAKIAELTTEKKDCIKGKDEISEQIKNIEDGKQKDGSSKLEDKRSLKELSFWQKAGKVGMGILTGTLNVAKSLVGFDKDGKWNWKKCLKNVAIGVGVAALCVFAAPLGAGLAATLGGGMVASAVGTAVAATPTILACAGLASGTCAAGKGIYKACKAETAQELENASQEIGSGAAIALASKAGLKKISVTGGYTKADGGFLGLKNISVNAFKTSKANFETAKQVMNFTGGGIEGFIKSCKYTLRNAKNKPVEESKNHFETKKAEVMSNLEKKINEAQIKVNNSTGAEKRLAQTELKTLKANHKKLSNAKTKKDWENIKVANEKVGFFQKHKMTAGKKVKYNINKEYNKSVSELKSLKFKSIRKMLGNKHYKNDIKTFGIQNNSSLQNYYTCTRYGIQMPSSKMGWLGKSINLGFIAIDPWWAAIGPAQKLTGSTFGFYNSIAQSWKPIHEFCGEQISAEEVETSLAELKTQKEQLQKEINKLDTALRELSA